LLYAVWPGRVYFLVLGAAKAISLDLFFVRVKQTHLMTGFLTTQQGRRESVDGTPFSHSDDSRELATHLEPPAGILHFYRHESS